MTYREDFTLPAELLEQVQAHGLEVLPELIRVILNVAMQAERLEKPKLPDSQLQTSDPAEDLTPAEQRRKDRIEAAQLLHSRG